MGFHVIYAPNNCTNYASVKENHTAPTPTVSIEPQRSTNETKKEVPLWEKSNLTLEEAAVYSGIGINKLRKMSDNERCTFVLWNGSKRLIKRRKLDEYLDHSYSI